jgi:hypothetical protein
VKRYCAKGKKIYYLDKTWLTAGHTPSKTWVDDNVKSSRQAFLEGLTTGVQHPTGAGKCIIIVHIGNEDGFVDGGCYIYKASKSADYHAVMDGTVFCRDGRLIDCTID